MVSRRISHYRILNKLGEGGMGEVYLAEDSRLGRKVAVKLLGEEFNSNEDRLRRFIAEAKAASALNHPNIITVYDIGEAESGSHFIATEYIEGETLRHHIERSRMKTREVLDIVVQVASALAAAHQAGIIHRDVKPENVMLRPDGYVKVLDFGLAKLTEKQPPTADSQAGTVARKKTDPGTVMGTVQYMSPEQARGKEVDARSDIFSLGVVLYELVARRAPFAGESSTDVLAAILDREPLPLARYADDIAPELQRIVTKCLRKERDERYQTMKDLLLDLKELRDEMALEAKLERSVRPKSDTENQQTLIVEGEITKHHSGQATSAASAKTTSSAEYLVSEIRQHKRGVAIVLLGLLMAATGLAYLYFSNRSASARQIESIAVMPFVNESGNADVEYLSDGMTETLIKSLSQIQNLNVKPRSSVFRYKGKNTDLQAIAKELNVRAILTGRVVQRGDQLTLSLELVDAAKDSVIWSEQYNRKTSDLVSLQSEIARDVSTKLKSKLSGGDSAKVEKTYTANSEAYQLYLKGRYHWNKRTYDDFLKAIENFKAAIEKDNGFALAYSGLADTYSIVPYYHGSRSGNYMQQAKLYARQAVELDDQLAETHTSLAFVSEGTWNWSEAEKHYDRAIEINPNYSTAQMRYARFEIRVPNRGVQALARMKRALELEPSSLVTNDNLSQVYLALGEADASLEQARRTVELDPQFSFGWIDLTYAQIKRGQYADALSSATKAAEVAKRANRTLICLGVANAAAGRRSEAMAIVKEIEERYRNNQGDATEVAAVYAGLGDKDQAFGWLDKAFADHSSLLVDLRAEYPFAALRDDRRYKDLLKRMNLPE